MLGYKKSFDLQVHRCTRQVTEQHTTRLSGRFVSTFSGVRPYNGSKKGICKADVPHVPSLVSLVIEL
jgi:hypothetical protein